MTYYIYIVSCADGTLYTGYTCDLKKRIRAHNESLRGAKYTRARRPVKLVYSEKFKNKNEAIKREWAIKKLSRKEKLIMVGITAKKIN